MLRKQPHRILVDDSLMGAAIGASGDGSTITIPGYGDISEAQIVHSYKQCAAGATAQVDDVTVVIPSSCECPYEWPLRIICQPDLRNYEVQTTFPTERNYGYEDPAGGTPTATDTAAAIVASINADPFACVTATDQGGGVIRLTAKDGVLGFSAYTSSGSVASVTAPVRAILSIEDMRRLFPVKHGSFGQSNPAIPSQSGDYCAYHFRIRKAGEVQDDAIADAYQDYEQEVIFYADQNAANFANFDGGGADLGVAGVIPSANGGTCTAC